MAEMKPVLSQMRMNRFHFGLFAFCTPPGHTSTQEAFTMNEVCLQKN